MKLSTLYTSVPEYIEFGWVTAPNAAGQSISANTITTLTLDTEVQDTGGIVVAPGTAPAAVLGDAAPPSPHPATTAIKSALVWRGTDMSSPESSDDIT
jgi:hypothetical protein